MSVVVKTLYLCLITECFIQIRYTTFVKNQLIDFIAILE